MRKIILFLFSLFAYFGAYAQIGIIEGLNSTTLPTGWATSGFLATPITPCEGTHVWRINFYSDYDDWDGWDYGTLTGSITSPNLTAASNGTDIDVSFDWKANEYSVGDGVGYTMYVEYSLNNGTNWIQIGSPIVANSDTACAAFLHTIPAASVPIGSNFKFRVRGTWSSGDSYFWIDNIVVKQTTEEVPACTVLTSPANGSANISSGLITWSVPNGIPNGYKLRVGTTPGGSQIVNTEDVGSVTSYDLGNLISGITYYVSVTPYNLNGDATGCIETSFASCGSLSNFIQGFETTATGTIMPECWSRKYISTSTFASVSVSTSYAKTGTKSLAFYNAADTSAKLYAVTPMLTTLPSGTHRIKVSARGSAGTSFEVGTMTDPTDEATFTSFGTFPTTTSFQDFAVNFDSATTASYVAFKANFGSTYTYVYLDDVTWEPIPSCPDVAALTYTDVTSSTATINWEAGGSETAWQYAVGASTVTDPSTLTPVNVTTGNPTADVSDLTPNTAYKFWIRASCGAGSFGEWKGSTSFTTSCTAFSIPSVLENFDGTTGTALPGCWSTAAVTGTANWVGMAPGTTGDITTTVSGTRIVSKTYTSSNSLLFSTPFNYSAITQGTRVSLYLHRHASAPVGDKYAIYANTVPSLEGAEMLLEIFSKTTTAPAVAATGFYNYMATIPESFNGESQVYIIVQGYTNNGFSSYALGVDDFKVEYLPSCPEVALLSYENVESSTATINWEAGSSETAWQYAVGASTVTDPGTLTAVDVTGGNPNANLSDLTPNTTYKFWVRANCGSGSFGAWIGAVSFTTACEAFGNFMQGFESTATGTVMPDCWSRKYTTNSIYATVNVSTSYAKTGTKSLAFYNAADTSAKLYAVTPILTALGNGTHRIKFSARGSVTATIEVGTMTDPNDEATFTSVETFPMTTSFQDFAFNFDYSTTDSYVAFRANFGSTYSYSYMDDVIWEPIPACPDVIALSSENIESATATINWEAGGSEVAWQYAIGVSTVTDPATLTAMDVTGNNPTADVSDLTPNTTYKFWARANCGAGSFGGWVGPVSFTTACVSEMAPTAVQTFETAVPGCWSEATAALSPSITLSGTSSTWGAATAFANVSGSTNKAVKINLYGTKNDWIISNQIDLGNTVGDYRVSYKMALTSYDGTTAQATLGTHKVSVIVSADGGETWSDADVIKAYTGAGFYSNTGQAEKINLSAYSGVVKIAFVATTTVTSPDVDFHIDDFAVEPLPACADVFNLSYQDVTSSLATLNWQSDGSETAWQYAIGGSTVTDPSTLTAVDVTGNNPTADVSDLTANTTYKFWVRANCGAGSFGAWVGPVSFTTSCAAFSIPSTLENFDGTTGTALPGCWSASVVSGTANWVGMTPGLTGDITTTVSGTKIVAKSYTSSNALLVSTPFNYSAITEATRVNLYLHRHASAAAADKYTVYVNTSPSLTGAEMVLEVFSKTTIAPTVAATGFYNYTADIPASFNGASQVYIIIQGYTNNGLSSYALGVDDFKIELTGDLKNPTVEASSFKLYPNPVKEVLNISYNQNITNVEVFNMLGQQVLVKSVNATEGKLDMSNLAAGSYLVKVAAGNQVKTIKVIKQ